MMITTASKDFEVSELDDSESNISGRDRSCTNHRANAMKPFIGTTSSDDGLEGAYH